jgi:syntaxin-binding protein 5
VVVADVMQMKDSACLACYLANGNLIVYSLPALRPLLTLNSYLPLADVRWVKVVTN